MKRINIGAKRFDLPPAKKPMDGDPEITNMMLDARYLRQSSSLIQDALQKGFDVLQLANGDIVTTGTKTVVYQYTWDNEQGKLMKIKPKAERKVAPTVAGEEEEEIENEDS
jgi:hypothetical protein